MFCLLGLSCCPQAFASCNAQASNCDSFSCCTVWKSQGVQTSIVVVHALLVAPQQSSWTSDWASVPCISWQILNHWTTIEVPYWFLRHLHLSSIISPKQIFLILKYLKSSKWYLMRMLRIVYYYTFFRYIIFSQNYLIFLLLIFIKFPFTFCLASSWKPKLNDNRVIACLIQYI